jgi:phenylacetate-CoA ligase
MEVLSSAELVVWPAIPGPAGASMLAMQWQLERSQWWSRQQIVEQQFRQLRALAAHAVTQVPWYREALRSSRVRSVADLTPESFRRWPVLTTAEARANQQSLYAAAYPQEHGALLENQTTGSTGVPLRLYHTEVSQFFTHAMAVRDHLLHERDLSLKLAVIRGRMQAGSYAEWGAMNAMFATGPSTTFNAAADIGEQLDWLMRERPAYLHAHAGNLRALLMLSRDTGKVPWGMKQLISFAGMLAPAVREMARDLWGATVADTYGVTEFGIIASQCPGYAHFLVNAENVYVEVLRDDGTPCEAGESGRVVVTGLHNFAMPLIRYELGDYAEQGAACPAGRGLPVLNRIMGRTRNMLRDPTGRRAFPTVSASLLVDVAPIRQWRLVQRTLAEIELQYVGERPLSAYEQSVLTKGLSERLGYPFSFVFTRLDAFERAPGGKFEDFVSLVPQG